MDNVRFGVVGLGNMGLFHVETFASLKGGTLGAICDAAPANLARAGQKTPAKQFSDYREMLDSGLIDAVLIATPHFLHPEIALAAFDRGIHVLCEKPLAVTVGQGRSVMEASARKPELKFGLMFQMRTTSLYKKIRELIADGELGEISRITWIVTDWFRTWTYFASGGWRATWAGEGGGVLINQCPHNLDLIQWLTGLTPSRITAIGFVGKTHPIEVEDEVSAILEYPSGAIGHFITSTGEAPGTNRLEICGDRGKLVAEKGKISFSRTRKSVKETRETSKEAFAVVEAWDIDVPVGPSDAEGHKVITQNFVNAVLNNEPLIAPGPDGLRELELGNAIAMAALTRKVVELPLDSGAYDRFLEDMKRQYGGRKTLKADPNASADISKSFKH
ncbi:MAG TPA: Gfo/Idh/MocA family oxidoreductase [Tepidisphaeraceae bacterium]|jgi:predicted dehydrogenase